MSEALLATAQESLRLEFKDGRVWLSARDVPVRVILEEWGRLSGATIVNGERVVGGPVTLELQGVPELEAVRTVLQDVPGYILAPRPEYTMGQSAFRLIIVLPTTTSPAPPPSINTSEAGQPERVIPPELSGPLADALRAGLSGSITAPKQTAAPQIDSPKTPRVSEPNVAMPTR